MHATTTGNSGGQDPPGNGTGRKGGGSYGRGKEPEGKGGKETSKFGSRFHLGRWGKRKDVGVQEFKIDVPSDDLPDLPVHEGVDEDAQGDTATWKEQLMLLASYGDDDGIWKEEVLRAEGKEQEEMKQERMVRLDNWRHRIFQ